MSAIDPPGRLYGAARSDLRGGFLALTPRCRWCGTSNVANGRGVLCPVCDHPTPALRRTR